MATSKLDALVEELRQLREEVPDLFYVGRRTDYNIRRVQLDVTPALAEKLIPVIAKYKRSTRGRGKTKESVVE